jgi:predicted permease
MTQWLRITASRLRAVFTKQRLDREFEDELKHHLESLTEEYAASGMSGGEARRAAALKLGHPDVLREENRDQRGMPALETLARDLRFAVRTLWKSPGFTSVAVLTLLLGIGLCSSLFSVLNGLILEPLPGAREPGRLVALQAPVTYPYLEHYRDRSGVATAAAAFIGPEPFGVSVGSAANARPERISGHLVSPEYFSTLGVAPLLGRFFAPALERPGGAPTVVVSERFWRMRLNSDPHALGRTVQVNGRPATLVGVAQKGFLGVFPANPADLFIPITADAAIAPELAGDVLHRTTDPIFRVLLRLAPGVAVPAAEAALEIETRRLDEEGGRRDPNRDRQGRLARLILAGGTTGMPSEQRSLLIMTYGLMMGLILSFTCANLAGLTLARGGARGREIAICLSLGATRFRVIRQLLMESVVLSTIGGGAGLAIAYVALNLLTRSLAGPAAFPAEIPVAPDLRVTLLTFAISALAGAGFGLMPALVSTRSDLVTGLKETSTAGRGRYRRFGVRNLFMVYQVAAAMTLVMIMGFMVTGLQRGTNRDPGFDTAGLYLFSLDPARDGYSPEESAAMFLGLPERLGRLNGVDGVTLADQIPVFVNADSAVSTTAGDGQEVVHQVAMQAVGPRFFATLGVPMLRGAEFGDRDLRSDPGPGAMLPVVINHVAARQLFGDSDPLGRIIRKDERIFQVAGVVRYGKPAFFRNEPAATVFPALTTRNFRRGPAQGSTVVVRARKGVGFAAIKRELEAVDSRLTMFNMRTMQEDLDRLNRTIEYVTAFYGGIGMFALILACIGLAGVTAQALVQRRKEIGIRMALGAQRRQVLRLVMKDGAAMALAGCVLGVAAAMGVTRALASLSAGFAQNLAASASDPVRILGAPLLLISVAAIACYLPARRSASIDPLKALREE